MTAGKSPDTHETPARRGRGRRPRPEARRNRQRILRAADRMVAQHGRTVTLATVASAAGLSVPSIIRGFGSKDGLLEAVLDHAVHRCRRGLAAHLELVETGALPRGDLPEGWYRLLMRWFAPGSALGNLLGPPDGHRHLPAVAETLWPSVARAYPAGALPWGDLVHLAVIMAHAEGLGPAGRTAVAQGVTHALTGRAPSAGPDPDRDRHIQEWLVGTHLTYVDLADDPDDDPADQAWRTPPADGAP